MQQSICERCGVCRITYFFQIVTQEWVQNKLLSCFEIWAKNLSVTKLTSAEDLNACGWHKGQHGIFLTDCEKMEINGHLENMGSQ